MKPRSVRLSGPRDFDRPGGPLLHPRRFPAARSLLAIGALASLLWMPVRARAQSSSDILRHGLHDTIDVESDEHLFAQLREYLSWDSSRVSQARSEGSGSLTGVFAGLIRLGLGTDHEAEEIAQTRAILNQDKSYVTRSDKFLSLKLRLVNPAVVEAWRAARLAEIAAEQAKGVTVRTQVSPEDADEFTLTVTYNPPWDESPRELCVSGITAVGATKVGEDRIHGGDRIRRCGSLTQAFRRTGPCAGAIVIDFVGAGTAGRGWSAKPTTIPAKITTTAPKPLEAVSARLVLKTTRNKERDGSIWIRLAHLDGTGQVDFFLVEDRKIGEGVVFHEDRPAIQFPVPVARLAPTGERLPGPATYRPGNYRFYLALEGKNGPNIHYGGEAVLELTLSDGSKRSISTSLFRFEDCRVVDGNHPTGNTGVAIGDTTWER